MAIVASLVTLVIIVYFGYESCVKNNNDGIAGMLTTVLVLATVVLWILVADYNKPTLKHTVEGAVSVQVDTTFIVHPDKVDTLYTINYEEINKDSREYEKSK